MQWIRFEAHSRYHAVVLEENGAHLTYCGRYAAGQMQLSDDPKSRCVHCVSRIAKPYLLPLEVRQKMEKAGGKIL